MMTTLAPMRPSLTPWLWSSRSTWRSTPSPDGSMSTSPYPRSVSSYWQAVLRPAHTQRQKLESVNQLANITSACGCLSTKLVSEPRQSAWVCCSHTGVCKLPAVLHVDRQERGGMRETLICAQEIIKNSSTQLGIPVVISSDNISFFRTVSNDYPLNMHNIIQPRGAWEALPQKSGRFNEEHSFWRSLSHLLESLLCRSKIHWLWFTGCRMFFVFFCPLSNLLLGILIWRLTACDSFRWVIYFEAIKWNNWETVLRGVHVIWLAVAPLTQC